MVRLLGRTGLWRDHPPWLLPGTARDLRAWGASPAGALVALARRAPGRCALVDDDGSLTVRELDERTDALAAGLAARGVGPGDAVAVLCRNHRGLVGTVLAAGKLGADVLLLNTGASAPQVRDLLVRYEPRLLVRDGDLPPLPAPARETSGLPGTSSADVTGGTPAVTAGAELEALAARRPARRPAPSGRTGRLVVLTSGTTGTPRAARRRAPGGWAGVDAALAALHALPFRAGGRTHIAAPLFHSWGLGTWALALALGSTVVLRRRFDPAECLRVLADERCDALVAVPVMLQRILRLPEEDLDAADLPLLRLVASSGSALPGRLAADWMDRFGDSLYNVYGSTEVAVATVAGPADLREAPGTAGRAPYATTVRLLDADGREVPPGRPGRVFVGGPLLLPAYAGGGGRPTAGGLMSTGDVGRFDAGGRLTVEGREDDLVVTGGENVWPREVEDCLLGHPDVAEVAVVGVPDPELGARLVAFVVRRAGAAVDAEGLRDHVRARLARFQVPREVRFGDALPRNATGKVLRAVLAGSRAAGGAVGEDGRHGPR